MERGRKLPDLRILVVENDADRLPRLMVSLREEAPPVVVPNISEALEALSIQKFDAILLNSSEEHDAAGALASGIGSPNSAEGAPAVLFSREGVNIDEATAGILPLDFTSSELHRAVENALDARSRKAQETNRNVVGMRDFDSEGFEEQCAHESFLMVEIIDLFFEECHTELPAMREALSCSDFDQLNRLAHTIKGSLGSLHAPLGRQRAQDIELAAKARDSRRCGELLGLFEADLAVLNRALTGFREDCLQR
jgi:HPt (histidine-containing phosphotransfer) domain-containing protein